ncbi:short-chain dehydrogenase/reductase, partial [Xylariales sp. PMI_506]
FLRIFLSSQLFRTVPYPTQSFAKQTVIITGSNVGLGLEAARHVYRLGCAKLILAVRTISKGEAAKEDIMNSVKNRSDSRAIEVWPLDMSSTKSTLAFAERVKAELPRVDVLVENAGVHSRERVDCEGFEQTIQVNVVNTFLLGLCLLPKLAETKHTFADSSPHLVVVSSEAHHLTKFEEINAPDIYRELNDNKKPHVGQHNRYEISKLMEVLLIRELVSHLDDAKFPVIITLVNPGLCNSTIGHTATGPPPPKPFLFKLFSFIERTTEVGSRTLVLGACADLESHGQFMSDGKNQEVEAWIYEDVGKRAQKKVFDQTMKVLEARRPGIGEEL